MSTKQQLIKKIIQLKMENGRLRTKVQSIFTEPSMTQQQFKDEVDVNKIIAKFKKTGQISHLSNRTGTYGDFSEIPDYQQMLHTIMDANEKFAQLPSQLREKFSNDPQNLINYLQDPKNTEESIKLGLRIEKQLSDTDRIISKLDELKTQPASSKKND